eukprot:CAMPEP_0180248850 /NCGR_PEP_ID=MMETSP0987-20121128/36958_1 /TAXON_ID=697907 /ORGANISM="non described non described, Strain CCMP2293" /LENGTH=148 /DNA_ID=CAMNT_0022217021 /DNA_START=28 /DNA_END=474 /DNA_ORIENTATION=-
MDEASQQSHELSAAQDSSEGDCEGLGTPLRDHTRTVTPNSADPCTWKNSRERKDRTLPELRRAQNSSGDDDQVVGNTPSPSNAGMPASPPPKIQKISTGETQANDIMQAAQDRAEHRVHPQCSPANRSTVCGTSSSKKQLNPRHSRTL